MVFGVALIVVAGLAIGPGCRNGASPNGSRKRDSNGEHGTAAAQRSSGRSAKPERPASAKPERPARREAGASQREAGAAGQREAGAAGQREAGERPASAKPAAAGQAQRSRSAGQRAERRSREAAGQRKAGAAGQRQTAGAAGQREAGAASAKPAAGQRKPEQPARNAERQRLDEADTRGVPWRRWGPYLSERQWGTVREDYGGGGDAWSSFTHDQARSRAYRWGEDGLAGISDDRQLLCLALALWNERDPILKERMFGLTNAEGNHGEDVKECYFYLDATPTSSYLKMLYKYPQAEFPYADLVATNGARGKSDPEYELIDTGIFDDDRYFDVVVEYAKASPEDVLLQVTVHNRGPEDATVHVLPTLWFRHTWSWAGGSERPLLRAVSDNGGGSAVEATHGELGTGWLYADGPVPVLVTGNETNNERVFGSPNELTYVKDGIDRAVVHGEAAAVDPGGTGTKAALHYVLNVPAGGSATVRLRLTDTGPAKAPFGDFDEVMNARRDEADEFWADVLAGDLTDDERLMCRQALAGMLWSKQYYGLDMERWLAEHGVDPLGAGTGLRNEDWRHLIAEDIISMPDKWEYPWFAAWDLAFHAVALAVVDVAFAKQQLDLLLNRRYLHPNGQLPAYEWNFSDVNPPVHAWATWFVYELEKAHDRQGGPGLPGERLPEADEELRLVAQPQGRGQPQHLPGRLPRPRQHRRVRPQRAAAGRRPDRPGGRHRVDGAVLPEHAADRRSSSPGRTRCTSSRRSRCWRTSPGSARRPTMSAAAGSACGTRRTASSTTSCGARTAARSR